LVATEPWQGLAFVALAVDAQPPRPRELFLKTVFMVVDRNGRPSNSLPVWNDLTNVTFPTTAGL
jgi:hypothetical protein